MRPRIRKIRWLCRRGMKELDVLLERFLEQRGAGLREADLELLERLLESEDDVLWSWFQQPRQCPDPTLQPLLELIRSG